MTYLEITLSPLEKRRNKFFNENLIYLLMKQTSRQTHKQNVHNRNVHFFQKYFDEPAIIRFQIF